MDDFREAYHWLRENTHNDARIMSWWDYGYQIAGMANRTTLVDNNVRFYSGYRGVQKIPRREFLIFSQFCVLSPFVFPIFVFTPKRGETENQERMVSAHVELRKKYSLVSEG